MGSGEDISKIGLSRALRLIRIVRLTRIVSRTRRFRELHKLIRMMATCLKALLWSFVFCFVCMTVWAMLIVEVINPLVQELHSAGELQDCSAEYCITATSSVMDANLLLFKTVIAGDSWGELAVPVIKEYPSTAIIFMGSLLTLVFGVLNLIVAVVVDTFAEARQRDVMNLAEELEMDFMSDRRRLQKIFDRMDQDGSGIVTFEELVEGARADQEFQSRLRVMDIDESDLQQLFDMIDITGEGEIKSEEFIAALSRWVHDSKTAPRFVKYNMQRALQMQDDLFKLNMESFQALAQRIDLLARGLDHLLAQDGLFDEDEPLHPLHLEESGGSVEKHAEAVPVQQDGIVEEPNASKSSLSSLLAAHKVTSSKQLQPDMSVELKEPPPSPIASNGGSKEGPRATSSPLMPPLGEALEGLEAVVAKATEQALKRCMAMMEAPKRFGGFGAGLTSMNLELRPFSREVSNGSDLKPWESCRPWESRSILEKSRARKRHAPPPRLPVGRFLPPSGQTGSRAQSKDVREERQGSKETGQQSLPTSSNGLPFWMSPLQSLRSRRGSQEGRSSPGRASHRSSRNSV